MSLQASLTTLRAADQQLQDSDPTPFPLPASGLEPVLVGALAALGRGDWWVPGLRERVGAVLRDVPVERLVDGFAGARPYRVAPPTAHGPLRAGMAVGLALAEGRTTLVHLGIGAVADGAFAEAVNLAVLHGAPVIFCVAAHPLTGDAPLGRQWAADPATWAQSFGLPFTRVDGTAAEAVRDAVTAAKDAGGPQLVWADLPGA